MIDFRKFISIGAVAAALAGSIVVASPALADSYSCNDRGCRVYVSHRTLERAARHAAEAAEDAATAAAWAHYYHEHLDD